MAVTSEAGVPSKSVLGTWLFNPFFYVAGGTALGAGIALILIAGLIGFLSNSHFDGVLDFHSGLAAPFWACSAEGLIDWLAMGVALFVAGRLLSKSRFRALDLFGTQALARGPMVITALSALPPGSQRFGAHIVAMATNAPQTGTPSVADGAAFGVMVVVGLIMLVWMVALMYRAYAVSCNISGARGVISFIVALLAGEALSKLLIILLLRASVA